MSANQASYLTQSYKPGNNLHLIHLYRKNKTSYFRPRYFLETYYDTSISSFFHIFLSKYIQSIFCLTWNSFFFYFLLYLCLFPFVLLRLWRSTQNQTIKQTNPKERWGSKSPCNHLLAPSLACLIHLCQAIHGVRQPQKPHLTSIGAWFNQNLVHPWNFARSEIQEKDRGEGEKGIYDKNSHY